MDTLIIIIFVGLLGLLFWLLFLLIKTSKHLTKRPNDHNWTETSGIIILLILGVIILPWFFTQTAFSVYNFSTTGQIGDTIGGITAPFINGIGAILIYIAFKEQVKSSNSARQEKRTDLIINNLNKLEDDPYNIETLCADCITDLTTGTYQSNNILKLTRVLREFQSISTFIAEQNESKNYLENKFYLTWKMIYQPHVIHVNHEIVNIAIVNSITFILGDSLTFNDSFVSIENISESYT